jgi:hypothetical protein
MNPRDEKFLESLLEIREQDPALFMNLVLESLKRFPDLAVEDDQPTGQKISALKTMLRHFEKEEKYEDCAFIRDLQKRIEDEEERGLSRNEQ